MDGRTDMETVSVRITVKGKVQMVGYRYFARLNAQEMGVRGWVRNLPNGDVEVVAGAEHEVMEEFIALLKRGPSSAVVRDMLVNYDYPMDDGMTGFSVRF